MTRSTFAAELFGLCDGIEHSLLLRQIVHEFECGVLTTRQARELREGAVISPIGIHVYIDALSVFQSVTAAHVKAPAEPSLMPHGQFCREFLDRKVLEALSWTDTRDMIADGLTKGAVSRDLLELLADGFAMFRFATISSVM